MAQNYAFIKQNGKVLSLTRMSAQDAAMSPGVLVKVNDSSIQVGDFIDKDTGLVSSRNTVDTQESRAACRELVRQEMRNTDWTQTVDALSNPRKALWATYRIDLKANWQAAKVTDDPLSNMVWPVAPGDSSDGL